ncbi:hypothetical protein BD410DRAFT_784249 [Rickenella mellea]|uniref:Uncharacterized protein n=1 Tax=Rickenella mellea TaxID=50990 RepID=A0A4Y7QFJ2_9AGAM|nr:hypothetical protein BD410DRAFT_784249 [Rickenella mellea]
MRAPTTYWETYESQLSDAGRGLPLWNPGPYREVDGTACPVRLGDVGYMLCVPDKLSCHRGTRPSKLVPVRVVLLPFLTPEKMGYQR